MLQGKVAKIIEKDVDQDTQNNQFIDEFHLLKDISWPVDSNSIDLIVCDNVLEHIEDPDQLFMEIHRVIKDGGYLCIRTPNRWSYIALTQREENV
ncbi:MAG: hypothetical protein DRJ13_05245 [Bacteroidetes bacterium]|nr:MAG: hypothetical protein DRJ13_05245 [Bacteroidota bacterium]